MSVYEIAKSGFAPENEPSPDVIGNYPYGNLSVSAMAHHLNERIAAHQKRRIETDSQAAELPDRPDKSELPAEAA
jgi:hypothetical protein